MNTNDTNSIPERKAHIHHLELHVSHSCNLRCANCSHYCNIGYHKKIDHVAALESIEAWSKRITVKQFALLGGEPLIEKRVTDYIRKAAEVFPYAERRLVTNGVLLYNHSDDLAKLISETKTRLIVSLHVIPEQQKSKMLKSLSVLNRWIKEYSVNATIKAIDSRWFQIYRGTDCDILPFAENNPAESKRHCTTPCVNLVEGALWKCPPLAYLPMIIDKLRYRKAWEPYLAYQPLQLSASDEAINNLPKDTHCCEMCPTHPKLDMVQKLR